MTPLTQDNLKRVHDAQRMDDLKCHSSMTLFAASAPEEPRFAEVLRNISTAA